MEFSGDQDTLEKIMQAETPFLLQEPGLEGNELQY